MVAFESSRVRVDKVKFNYVCQASRLVMIVVSSLEHS